MPYHPPSMAATPLPDSIQVIDSHTGGEPTRVVIAGGPDLGGGPLAELGILRRNTTVPPAVIRTARLRRAGRRAAVRARRAGVRRRRHLLQQRRLPRHVRPRHHRPGRDARPPRPHRAPATIASTPRSAWSTATLARRRRGLASTNVPSCRTAARPGRRGARPSARSRGDVAWGGNWFFLVDLDHDAAISTSSTTLLTDFAWRIRHALNARALPGGRPHRIVRPPARRGGHSRNFVLCPGKAYDRSPCGTGTSAKLACLAADGKLAPRARPGVQESIVGSIFRGSFRWLDRARGEIAPTITRPRLCHRRDDAAARSGRPVRRRHPARPAI